MNSISIIVPVYNRASEIEEFLDSLTRQTCDDFDIVIVDDGSSDNLKEIINKYQEKLKIDYYFQQNKGPGEARNLGMSKAKGDWFVFIDSDCTMPPEYIANIQKNLTEGDCDAFGGPDTYREDFPDFLKAVNYSMTSFLGTGGTRGSKGKKIGRYYPRSFNMGIRRKVYQTIDGMNRMRHGQDMDFSNRVYKAGFSVRYFDNVYVYHKRRTDLRKFFKQIFNWGVGRINLGRIDKQMLKPVHSLPFLVVMGIITTVILVPFWKIALYAIILECWLAIIVAIMAYIQSKKLYGSHRIGMLSILTLFTQVLAYGLGFGYGLIKSLQTGKGAFIEGFKKNYYK